MEDLDSIKLLIDQPKYTVIVSHRNPDGDAVGSSVGLYHLLRQRGHTVHICFPSEYPVVFEFILKEIPVVIYDLQPERVRELFGKADLVFALDFNALDRIDKVGEIMALYKGRSVMIDHHLDPEPFTDFAISDIKASSTAELVFDLIDQGSYIKEMNSEIATALLTGILTDTGCFAYSVHPDLMRKTATLIETGIDYKHLVDRLFNSWDEKYLKLLGHCLANRMELLPEFGLGIIYLDKEDYKNFNIQRGDTEGIVNYLLKLNMVNIAVLITEQPTIIKFSFRSKGDISVADLARKYFKGGGHKNASGGSMYGTINSAVKKVKESVQENYTHLYNDFS
jgi:bifunctional oligoribonuclease and PAP phosphatase NrnA